MTINAGTAKESGEHLLSLINQVLDFSKIESGHMDLEAIEFSLDAVVQGTVSTLTGKAQSKGLEILTHTDKETPERFLGDPLRLQQVLLNLVGNAVKFSDSGEIRISIRPLQEANQPRRLYL